MPDLLITGAHLLTMDPAVADGVGNLLVRDGRIAAVGDVPADAHASATVVDADGMVAMPGFVDTHRHTWQSALRHTVVGADLFAYIETIQMRIATAFSADDVYTGTLLGALTCLDAGITTLRDEAHVMNTPEHADAAIAALRDARIRARFAYGWPCDEPMRWMFDSTEPHPDDIRRVRADVLRDDAALVTLNAHLRGTEMVGVDVTAQDLALTRDLDIRSSMHVGNGEAGAKLHGIATLEAAGLNGPDITFVHCCTSTDEELRMLAAAGASASVCAQIESVMPGLGIPATGRLLSAAATPSFGIDVEVAASGDMFTVLRAALTSHQLLAAHDEEYAASASSFSPHDLLRIATIDGARALGLDDRIGSLTVGKEADIILIDGRAINLLPLNDAAGAIVAAGQPANVDTVLVGGTVLKQAGRLVGIDVASVGERARQSRERLLPDAHASGDQVREAVARRIGGTEQP